MNIAQAGMAALAALVAASYGLFGVGEEPGVDPMPVSSIQRPGFLLEAEGRDAGCRITPAPASGEMKELSLDPACVDLVPGLAGARWWIEREDGSVAFVRHDGVLVAEFAAGDGAAYESYAPQVPIMTLMER